MKHIRPHLLLRAKQMFSKLSFMLWQCERSAYLCLRLRGFGLLALPCRLREDDVEVEDDVLELVWLVELEVLHWSYGVILG